MEKLNEQFDALADKVFEVLKIQNMDIEGGANKIAELTPGIKVEKIKEILQKIEGEKNK